MMQPSTKSTLLTVARALRAVLVVAGIGIAAATAYHLATLPPPPPESDGFAYGMAGLFGGGLILLSLGVAALSLVLPTLLGREDPIGFNRGQRLALKGAGLLLVGGFVLALVVGFVSGFVSGLVLWFGLVVLAAVVVGATLAWRLAEALVDALLRERGERAP